MFYSFIFYFTSALGAYRYFKYGVYKWSTHYFLLVQLLVELKIFDMCIFIYNTSGKTHVGVVGGLWIERLGLLFVPWYKK